MRIVLDKLMGENSNKAAVWDVFEEQVHSSIEKQYEQEFDAH